MISIEKFVVNPLRENSYLLYDESGECILVDAGFYYEEEYAELAEFIQNNQLTPVMMVNTHCHFDHLMGVEFLRQNYRLKFYCHPDEVFLISRAGLQAEMFGFTMQPTGPADGFIQEGDEVRFGNSVLR